jgi:phosphoadenosine phosphosulfate reductase
MPLESIVVRAAELNQTWCDAELTAVLEAVFLQGVIGRCAVVSSFGAESAVLLHLMASIDDRIPVIFLDTGFHFPETLSYRKTLIDLLSLKNVVSYDLDPISRKRLDPKGLLHMTDPNACCDARKVSVLDRALRSFDAWAAGQKRYQAASRADVDLFEVDRNRQKLKFNPLANWSQAAIQDYFERHHLPSHPLVKHGYLSIGCAPCTSAVIAGESGRAGRWRGRAKTECGLHGNPNILLREGAGA